MIIRKAVIGDVNPIHKLLSHFADIGLLLPRSLSELYNHLRDYFVLQDEDGDRFIKGVAGLGICWEDLAEIRSLAVTETLQGKGFGSQLLESCLQEARLLGLKKILTLTYAQDFFKDHGFKEVERLTGERTPFLHITFSSAQNFAPSITSFKTVVVLPELAKPTAK